MDASSRAALTMDRARSAMQTTQIASLPEVVKLLRALAGNSQRVSVLELAEVIQNDPLVLAKVISAANMFAYNPNGVEVTSVSQAIHVIGYERLRTLAVSLMLAEQVSRTTSPEVQREYAAQSLMAGCLAQSLAAGRAILDREQAFICASLRNFGQIVLTSCMAEEFKQLREAARGEPDDEAYRQAFGLTPLELGHQLLDAANLPEDILVTLQAIPPDAFAVLERKPDDQLRALTAFAGELAALTLDPRSDPANFAANASELARRYEHVLPCLHEELHALMESAAAQLDQIVSTFRIKSLPLRLMTRVARCRSEVDPNRPVVAAPAPGPAAVAPPGALAAANAGVPAPPVPAPVPVASHDWNGSLNQFVGLLRRPGISRRELHAAVLQIVRAGLAAQECLLFSAEPGSRSVPLACGLGDVYRRVEQASNLEIVPGERTVFGVCLARNENIMIHHAREEKIQAYLPPWLKAHAGLGAFVLMPVSDGSRVGGVLLAGWEDTRQIALTPDCVRSLRTMLALVCRTEARKAA
jgi:HD-like signal output (HDOD) protein